MERVGLIADVHMRDSHADELRAELRWVGDHFEDAFEPDHVFVLGDVVQHGETGREDERNVREVADVLGGYSYDVTYLLGNHDVINLDRGRLSTLLDQERFYGEVTLGDCQFVYLDSSVRHVATPGGMVGPDQVSHLADSVSEDGPSFVLVHHPIGDFDLEENYWFAEFPEQAYLWDRKAVLEALDRGGDVVSTISGHIHTDSATGFRGTDHVSVGPFSKETPHRALTGTYAELTISDGITIRSKTREETVDEFHLEVGPGDDEGPNGAE